MVTGDLDLDAEVDSRPLVQRRGRKSSVTRRAVSPPSAESSSAPALCSTRLDFNRPLDLGFLWILVVDIPHGFGEQAVRLSSEMHVSVYQLARCEDD
jgi:hypothetical protein